jgi:hypothetical protein
MILRPTENENGGVYRRIVVKTPFPLMGKGRDRGAREPNRNHPTFVPVKGKDSDAVAGRFLHNLATSAALPNFRRSHVFNLLHACAF